MAVVPGPAYHMNHQLPLTVPIQISHRAIPCPVSFGRVDGNLQKIVHQHLNPLPFLLPPFFHDIPLGSRLIQKACSLDFLFHPFQLPAPLPV